MSTHHGVIGATTSSARLLAAMESVGLPTVAVPIPAVGPLAEDACKVVHRIQGCGMFLCQAGGRAYIVDWALSLIETEVIRGISAHADCLVVAGFAEGAAVVGALVVAERGEVRRSAWLDPERGTFCEDIGEPLATEADAPIDGHDGEGQWAAFRLLGFDAYAWETARPLEWRLLRSEAEQPHVQGVLRSMGVPGNEAAGGSAPRPRRQGLLSRLFGRA